MNVFLRRCVSIIRVVPWTLAEMFYEARKHHSVSSRTLTEIFRGCLQALFGNAWTLAEIFHGGM